MLSNNVTRLAEGEVQDAEGTQVAFGRTKIRGRMRVKISGKVNIAARR